MKPSRAFVIQSVVLVAAALVLAGCSTSKGKSTEPAYKGELKTFELYLYPLQASSKTVGAPVTGGWELYPGAHVDAWAFAAEPDPSKATVPGPELRVREGDTVQISFIFSTGTMAHSIHWHGIHVPWDQDGVPYVSQLPLGDKAMGGNGSNQVVYEFPVHQSGTYWYHCHVDTAHHMDMGMYGALIVEPADPAQDPHYDRDYTLMFDEWDRSHSHQNNAAYLNAISRSGDPTVTANDLYSYVRDYLLMNSYYSTLAGSDYVKNQPGVRETRNWYPVTYAPYFAQYDTFLINGHAFPETEMLMIKQGETIRLRFINAGEQVHSIHLHGHYMYVTHKDGAIVPLLAQLGDRASKITTEDEMRKYAQAEDTILIAPGERYDVLVFGNNPGPWMLHDHIALNEMNDYINPGGMSTMLCYADGWTFPTDAGFKNPCAEASAKMANGQHVTAGDVLQLQAAMLAKRQGTPLIVPPGPRADDGSMPGMDMGTTTPGSVPISPAPSPSVSLPTVSLPVP